MERVASSNHTGNPLGDRAEWGRDRPSASFLEPTFSKSWQFLRIRHPPPGVAQGFLHKIYSALSLASSPCAYLIPTDCAFLASSPSLGDNTFHQELVCSDSMSTPALRSASAIITRRACRHHRWQ